MADVTHPVSAQEALEMDLEAAEAERRQAYRLLSQFVSLVEQMRDAQREYLRERDRDTFLHMLEMQRQVDGEIQRLRQWMAMKGV